MNRNSRGQSPEGKERKGIFISSKQNDQEKPSVAPYLDTSLQGIKESINGLKTINAMGESSGNFGFNLTQTSYTG